MLVLVPPLHWPTAFWMCVPCLIPLLPPKVSILEGPLHMCRVKRYVLQSTAGLVLPVWCLLACLVACC